MSSTYDALSAITVQFAMVLAFSFVIERILEITKAAYDLADGKYNWYAWWTSRTLRTRDYIERRLRVFEYVDKASAAALLARFDAMMLGTSSSDRPVVPVLSGDLVRAVWCRATLKVLGALIGIGIAFGLGLDLVALVNVKPGDPVPPPTWFGQVVTGIAVGLGSGIVHKLITSIERKQKRNAEVAGA